METEKASFARTGVSAVTPNLLYGGTAQLSMAPIALAKNDFKRCGSSRKQTFMPLCFELVIAPAFNLVNMWAHFLLSVIF